VKKLIIWQRKDPYKQISKRLRTCMEESELYFRVGLDRLIRARNRAMKRMFIQKALEYDQALRDLMECYSQWKQDARLRALITEIMQPDQRAQPPAEILYYATDSLFLHECYQYLFQDMTKTSDSRFVGELEWACLVTGPRIGNIRVLDRLVPVQIAYQSAGGVRLSADSLRQTLMSLQESGHSLYGVFHSHRMNGPHGATPSPIDLNAQKNILEAAYPAIQAIFTKDGYLRFFSYERAFEIEVYGKGVIHINEKLFQLQYHKKTMPLLVGTSHPIS